MIISKRFSSYWHEAHEDCSTPFVFVYCLHAGLWKTDSPSDACARPLTPLEFWPFSRSVVIHHKSVNKWQNDMRNFHIQYDCFKFHTRLLSWNFRLLYFTAFLCHRKLESKPFHNWKASQSSFYSTKVWKKRNFFKSKHKVHANQNWPFFSQFFCTIKLKLQKHSLPFFVRESSCRILSKEKTYKIKCKIILILMKNFH